MKQSDVSKNIGHTVRVNNGGDLYFNREMQPLIDDYYTGNLDVRIVKLTKGGLVYVSCGNQFYSIPCKNIQLTS